MRIRSLSPQALPTVLPLQYRSVGGEDWEIRFGLAITNSGKAVRLLHVSPTKTLTLPTAVADVVDMVGYLSAPEQMPIAAVNMSNVQSTLGQIVNTVHHASRLRSLLRPPEVLHLPAPRRLLVLVNERPTSCGRYHGELYMKDTWKARA